MLQPKKVLKWLLCQQRMFRVNMREDGVAAVFDALMEQH
jgi:hypothetical protein